MDTRTQDTIGKIAPSAPQPVPEAKTDVYAWSPRRTRDAVPFVLTGDESEDEPAPDVGGEVGRTPRLLTAWQITGLVLGGVAIAAGVAGAIYLAQTRN